MSIGGHYELVSSLLTSTVPDLHIFFMQAKESCSTAACTVVTTIIEGTLSSKTIVCLRRRCVSFLVCPCALPDASDQRSVARAENLTVVVIPLLTADKNLGEDSKALQRSNSMP